MQASNLRGRNNRDRQWITVIRDLLRTLLPLAALVCTIPPAVADECSSLEAVGWVLGQWTRSSEKSITRESWRRVSEDTFEGESTTTSVATGEILNFETLRLVSMSDAVFYIAKVTENELPVPFRLTRCSEGVAVFENPAHVAPQKLTYRHAPGQARGGISEMDVTVEGGAMKAFTLHFVRDGGS